MLQLLRRWLRFTVHFVTGLCATCSFKLVCIICVLPEH
jgi:hypothetical protein